MPATRNSSGDIVVDGVRLTPAQVRAASAALALPTPTAVVTPMTVLRASGKKAGKGTAGDPSRYGLWFDGSSWHFLGKYKEVLPGTSWKPKNLNRARFTFNVGA